MITILIVATTAIISYICFQNTSLFARFDFSPYRVLHQKEWYRFISHAFLHADWVHLIVNMLVFFSFGRNVEIIFKQLENNDYILSGKLSYALLYFGGIIFASLSTFIKNRNNPYYVSVGASGAVSAVLFTSIFFSPMEKIYFYGIIPMPGIIFGVLYLAYSTYMSKTNKGNINHEAHLWGAVFGFLFPLMINPALLRIFINQF
jgi:membrane associated rhomboid family serine protease